MGGKEHVSERFRWLLALYRKPDAAPSGAAKTWRTPPAGS